MDLKKNPKVVESPDKVSGIYASITEVAISTASEIYGGILNSRLDKGKIIMVFGPERSGKSIVAIELDRMFTENKVRNRKVIFAQPSVDRPDIPQNRIFSRNGSEIGAISFETKAEIEKIFHENEVVVIDEVHFTPSALQSYLLQEIMLFIERGGIFVGLGLYHTSQGGEFVFSALLKSRAERVFGLSSICQMCGRKADKYVQRLIDGSPASFDTPLLLSPSENVTYEPRCGDCFVVKK